MFPRCFILDAMGEYSGLTFSSFTELAEYITDNGYKEQQYICRFNEFLDVVYLFLLIKELGECCLCIDEYSIYLSDKDCYEIYKWIINFGRHKNISLIAVGRRPVELDADLRAQYTTVISFKQLEPVDLERLEKFGFSDLDQLKQYEYKLIGDELPI